MPKKKEKKELEPVSPVAYRTPSVARALNMSTRAVQRFIETKELKSFRVGRMRLVSRKAVEEFVRSREEQAEQAS